MASVIFLQNIKGVAQVGDVRSVADGYARNFLFPRKLAILATEKTLKTVEALRQKRLEALEKDKETTRTLAEKLKDFTLEITRATSGEGTLYDGLDAVEISGYLKKKHFFVEPEGILLQEHIKKVGQYEIEVDLGFEIKTTLKIEVKKLEE